MSERLHYFNEAATPVTFDLDDSDIDSVEDAVKRPTSDAERAKQHAQTFQLWSDEARRRRSVKTPQRRPSSSSLHDVQLISANAAFFPVALEERAFRASMDRQPSNLSDRSRNPPGSLRLSRSSSGKNLRIRITPTSSTKSLTSDIDSDSSTVPNSPLKSNLTSVTQGFHSGTTRRKDPNATLNDPDEVDKKRKAASCTELRTMSKRNNSPSRREAKAAIQQRDAPAAQASAQAVNIVPESGEKATRKSSRRNSRPNLFRFRFSRLKKFLLYNR